MAILTKEEAKGIVEAYGIQSVGDAEKAVKDLMKDVLQAALEGELDHHIGYEKYERNQTDNERNGHYDKTVKSSVGPITLEIPRDRKGAHEPQVVKKGDSNISSIEDRIISMYGKGMSTRDINAHMKEIYGIDVSAEMVSKITDRILPKLKEWQSRTLDKIYPILYLDAIHFNVREEHRIIKKAVYIIMGINCDGMKDVLGIWVGENESSKFWLTVLTELKNRGVQDVLICCVDGLSGFSQAIETVFPKTEVQRCIVHQIRYCCRYVSYKDRKVFCKDMKAIYTAPSEDAALEQLEAFSNKWSDKYAYAIKSWEDNWVHLATFFKYPAEIRRLIYTTNPIESLNSSIRKVAGPKRIFPTNEATFKSVYLATQQRLKKWNSRTREWSSIIGHLAILFPDRFGEVIIR